MIITKKSELKALMKKGSRIEIKSPAKLNLSLEVMGRLENGYHDICSIMQSVSLYDDITIEPHSELFVSCSVQSITGHNNLVYEVASKLQKICAVPLGANIHIEKHIPLSSGLGGGSSNAATVLHGLNELWALGLSQQELKNIGSTFGSDIPFFFKYGTAYSYGSGTQIRQLPNLKEHTFLLIDPKCSIINKTASMYAKVKPENYTSGGLTRKLEARLRGGGDIPSELMYNVFDKINSSELSEVNECLRILSAVGIREVHTAGSGPYLFTVVKNKEIARAYQILLQQTYSVNSIVAESISRSK